MFASTLPVVVTALLAFSLGAAAALHLFRRRFAPTEKLLSELRADRRRLTGYLEDGRSRLRARKHRMARLRDDNAALVAAIDRLEGEHAALIVRYANLETSVAGRLDPLATVGRGAPRSGPLYSSAPPARHSRPRALLPAPLAQSRITFPTDSPKPALVEDEPASDIDDWLETITHAATLTARTTSGSVSDLVDTQADASPDLRELVAARDAEISRLRAQLAPLLGLPLVIAARESERDRLARRLAMREGELRRLQSVYGLVSRSDRSHIELDTDEVLRSGTLHPGEPVPANPTRAERIADGPDAPGPAGTVEPPRHGLAKSAGESGPARATVTGRPGGDASAGPLAGRRYDAPPAQVDNLKRIRGIGPVLEGMLNRLGIYQYRQIASWTDADILYFDEALEAFRGRIERDGWITGATIEHERKYGRPPAAA